MAHIKDSKLKFETSEEVKVAPTFDAMGLKEDLLRGVYAYSAYRAACDGVLLTILTILACPAGYALLHRRL